MFALEGVTLVDFGQYLAGPFGPMIIGDLGADVIKVEPVTGDGMRMATKPFFGCQRGKRDIALNIKTPAGLEIAQKLIAKADVVHHNMTRGVATKLGIDYAACRALRADIIYCNTYAYGLAGSAREVRRPRPAVPGVGRARVRVGRDRPRATRRSTTASACATRRTRCCRSSACSWRCSTAQRTGEGQELWTSLLDGGVIFSSDVFLVDGKSWDRPAPRPRPHGPLRALPPVPHAGRRLDLIAAVKDAEWDALCSVLHVEHLLDDARFATAASRHEHRRQLASLLEPVFRTKTARYWSRMLDDADVPNEVPTAIPVEAATVRVRAREGTPAEVRALGGTDTEIAIAFVAPVVEEGQLLAQEPNWQFGAIVGEEAIYGTVADPAELVAALGDRPVIAHDAKALGVVPASLSTTRCWPPTCWSPPAAASRSREICEERGLKADVDAAAGRRRGADPGAHRLAARAARRPRAHRPHGRGRAAVRARAARHGARGRPAQQGAPGRRSGRASSTRSPTCSATIFALAEEEFTIGSPQQLGAILFDKLGLSRKRRGKTGFSTDARVLQAIRDEHEIIPKVERWRELNQLDEDLPRRPAAAGRRESRIHTTFVQAAATTGRLASTNPNLQNVPVRTELGREIRGCFEAAPGNVLSRPTTRRSSCASWRSSPTSRC